ncbi:MAG TPA: Sapep family Mn(2+)-dependent dipeptidase [Thermoanaerobaculia bacterium]|nr:Sapep family Mn(2+)-dependent dipeptidase [Thermoanaerobaculia bacterium]
MLSLILAATLAANTQQALNHYEQNEAKRLVPMLVEIVRFPTHEHDAEAHKAQKAWLMKTAADLGFVARDAGKVTEIELPGPAGAPVLGLVVHGDVQPAEPDAWTVPPFEGRVENGYVMGRGSADDKGPLIQALLAMKSLEASGAPRTHTVRLLVGSEEESSATEMAEYLKDHAAPDYSLVLDSEFPVVVGEKAWDGLAVAAPLTERAKGKKPYRVESMDAGLSPSIVPDRAEVRLVWVDGTPQWKKLGDQLRGIKMPGETRLVVQEDNQFLRVVAYGKSAHSGVNLTGGRNALVALARVLEGKLPSGGADDLLAFARQAGRDLYGAGLGFKENDPVWGTSTVNVATIKPKDGDPQTAVLYINIRRIPPRTGPQAKAYLERFVESFNKNNGAQLTVLPDLSYFDDEPLGFDPKAKIVRRLMDAYTRATGESPRPAISGGGTYAKRLPNAIAFGMWFPGKPYPGHDVDEKIPVADLHRGARVLIHALTDIATGEKIVGAFGK